MRGRRRFVELELLRTQAGGAGDRLSEGAGDAGGASGGRKWWAGGGLLSSLLPPGVRETSLGSIFLVEESCTFLMI